MSTSQILTYIVLFAATAAFYIYIHKKFLSSPKPVKKKKVKSEKKEKWRKRKLSSKEEQYLLKISEKSPLVYEDLSNHLKVAQSSIKETVKKLNEKGDLWGFVADKSFIGVKYAKKRMEELFNVYEKLGFDTLLNEFNMASEKNLKALLLMIGISKGLPIKLDDVEKSVKLVTKEEIEKEMLVPEIEKKAEEEKYLCPNCNQPVSTDAKKCPNCEKSFQKCIICKLPVLLPDFTETPCCNINVHRSHIKEWLRIEEKCPNCGAKLREDDLP